MKSKFCILLICFSLNVFSQQDPLFSGDGFNVFQHNPASFGNLETFSANSILRIQWDGVQDAPRTLGINTGGKFAFGSKSKNAKQLELRLGLTYSYNSIGFQRNHDFKVAIGYPLKIGDSKLVIAVAPGLISTNLSSNWVPPQTPQDPLLPVLGSGTAFDMNAGIMFNWKTLYAGLSTTHLFTPQLGEINFSVARHYYLDFGYKIPVGKHHIFPMLQMKADGAGATMQALTYFVFKDDLFSVGLGYRLADAITAGVAFQKWKVRVAYHYDYMMNPLNTYGKGSHEIRLSYIIPTLKKDTPTED